MGLDCAGCNKWEERDRLHVNFEGRLSSALFKYRSDHCMLRAKIYLIHDVEKVGTERIEQAQDVHRDWWKGDAAINWSNRLNDGKREDYRCAYQLLLSMRKKTERTQPGKVDNRASEAANELLEKIRVEKKDDIRNLEYPSLQTYHRGAEGRSRRLQTYEAVMAAESDQSLENAGQRCRFTILQWWHWRARMNAE